MKQLGESVSEMGASMKAAAGSAAAAAKAATDKGDDAAPALRLLRPQRRLQLRRQPRPGGSVAEAPAVETPRCRDAGPAAPAAEAVTEHTEADDERPPTPA